MYKEEHRREDYRHGVPGDATQLYAYTLRQAYRSTHEYIFIQIDILKIFIDRQRDRQRDRYIDRQAEGMKYSYYTFEDSINSYNQN